MNGKPVLMKSEKNRLPKGVHTPFNKMVMLEQLSCDTGFVCNERYSRHGMHDRRRGFCAWVTFHQTNYSITGIKSLLSAAGSTGRFTVI